MCVRAIQQCQCVHIVYFTCRNSDGFEMSIHYGLTHGPSRTRGACFNPPIFLPSCCQFLLSCTNKRLRCLAGKTRQAEATMSAVEGDAGSSKLVFAGKGSYLIWRAPVRPVPLDSQLKVFLCVTAVVSSVAVDGLLSFAFLPRLCLRIRFPFWRLRWVTKWNIKSFPVLVNSVEFDTRLCIGGDLDEMFTASKMFSEHASNVFAQPHSIKE